MWEMQDSTKYLGHYLFLSRQKSDAFEFIVKRVASRLEGWQEKLLSKAGKATLIKSVVQALPVYSMSTFRLPVAITDKIDALTRRFWWAGSISNPRVLSLKTWDALCKPIACGGLGFRRAQDFNSALLAKMAWDFDYEADKLWVKVLKRKYGRLGNSSWG